MKSLILGIIIYAISSVALAGDEQEHLPKHVNAIITQDRTARDIARVAISENGAFSLYHKLMGSEAKPWYNSLFEENKAYHELRIGEKAKSPSMTYGLAYYYLLMWRSNNHGSPPNPLLDYTEKKFNAFPHGLYHLKISAADRTYDKYIKYLSIAAKLGDPTAEAALGNEYFWEPQRLLLLMWYMNHKIHGDTSDALRDFITEGYGGKVWALMLNKSSRLEYKSAQQGSPSALFYLAMGRVMLTNKLITRNYTEIDQYAPYLLRSIRSYIIHSKIGTFRKSSEYGYVASTSMMICRSYSKGGDLRKWLDELRNESQNRYHAYEYVKLIKKAGGVNEYCRKQ